MEVLGVPPWCLQLWSSHLSVFECFFVVQNTCGLGIRSHTGFAEGCPLSCVAMACVDICWHLWQHVAVPSTLPVNYVDNLEVLCDNVDSLELSLSALYEFCRCMDLQVDERQLFLWTSSPSGRLYLRDEGYRVKMGDRDLGGQVMYCKQLRSKVVVNRITATLPYFDKLRRANLPSGAKQLNVTQVLFPRALHGCKSIHLGKSHFSKLRTAIMKALRWGRAGASPLVRLCLTHHQLDPEWY